VRRPSPILFTLLVAACTAPTGPTALYDPSGAGFFDTPWPADARTNADGTADMTGFPNPSDSPLVQRYLDIAQQTVGFGANSPIYLRFDGPIDTGALPTPETSVTDDSPVLLIDVDPDSPDYGRLVPVTWNWQAEQTSEQPADLLAVVPLFGFPLHPRTTYALVVTTALAQPSDALRGVWYADRPDHAEWDALADALFFHHLGKRDVALATVFTVGDPLDEMARITSFLDHKVTATALTQSVAELRDNNYFRLYQGTYPGPVFQAGQRPYATEGGNFEFRADGEPIIQSWDDMRLAISTPPDPTEAPPTGWPVVIYQHGTGGSYLSFASGNDAMEPTSQFAMAGMVGVSIDQPLHGPRGGGPNTDLFTFNYLNPDAGRANFRQGAIDAIYLAMTLAKQGPVFTTDDGYTIPIDPNRIYFMGHSQGGLTGSLALPFLGQWVHAAVLSGAGGDLSITIVERKDPFDIAQLIGETLDFSSNETVTEYHPAIGMIQWLVDVTDPINYAPFWATEQGGWQEQAPASVLMFSGMDDADTPYRAAEALASAGHLPWLAPGVTSPDAQTLRGLQPVIGPLSGNVAAYDGQVTGAFSQWPNVGHFVVFDDPNAARIYREFLRSAAAGDPTIDRYPAVR